MEKERNSYFWSDAVILGTDVQLRVAESCVVCPRNRVLGDVRSNLRKMKALCKGMNIQSEKTMNRFKQIKVRIWNSNFSHIQEFRIHRVPTYRQYNSAPLVLNLERAMKVSGILYIPWSKEAVFDCSLFILIIFNERFASKQTLQTENEKIYPKIDNNEKYPMESSKYMPGHRLSLLLLSFELRPSSHLP